MLQRSTWSGLLLSAAVCTIGLLSPASPVLAQQAPAAAPATPPTAPAAPAAPAIDTGKNLNTLADDFLHYSLVNNLELAKANGETLLLPANKPEDVLRAFEAAANGRNFRDILTQNQRRADLKDVSLKLIDKLDEGFRVLARDPVRIRAEVDRLASGPRGYQNARDRLSAAGQFAAPIFIEYLQNNSKRDLHPSILRVMGEIGRPLLLPLIEALHSPDNTLRTELVNVIGQIRYPQALPALRGLLADGNVQGELKSAVENAIKSIDASGRAAAMAPSELSYLAAQNYYDKKASYLPLLADEKTNPLWLFDKGLNNVVALQVPTPIWNSLMAQRLAEVALRQDSSNSDAISLWLASSLRREIQLPEGATDPTKGTGPDAAFYARAAGPQYVNPVLTKALDAHDAALALRAIDALEATGGTTGLVSNGENSPLVRALSFPDRAVRFRAAFALARANPTSQFPAFFRVVPILAEAVNSTGSPVALIVAPAEDVRNKLADLLRNSAAHYTVFSGGSLPEALEAARRTPGIDVVILPSGNDVGRVADFAKNDYRLTGAPVLVTAPTADVAALRAQLSSMKGYAAIDAGADEPAISTALSAARADAGNVPLDADRSTQFASTALELLGTLAADHKSIFAVTEAVPTLADALRDKRPEIATAAARVLGKLNSQDGERALATAALNSETEPTLRIVLLESLAESAKRTGNAVDASAITSLIKLVAAEGDVKLRIAAATALGALNVPSNQATTLILQQAK